MSKSSDDWVRRQKQIVTGGPTATADPRSGEHNGESEEFTTTNLLELRVEAEAMRAIQASQVSAY